MTAKNSRRTSAAVRSAKVKAVSERQPVTAQAQVIARIATAEAWSPLLRHALISALEAAAPVPSIQALAMRAGCSRQYLWVHWGMAVNSKWFRLRDFLDWAFLMHAAGSARGRGRDSWRLRAFHMGVDPDTVSRRVRRMMQMSLREFEHVEVSGIAAAFIEWLNLAIISGTAGAPGGHTKAEPISTRGVSPPRAALR